MFLIQQVPAERLNGFNERETEIRSIRSIIAKRYVFYITSSCGTIKQIKRKGNGNQFNTFNLREAICFLYNKFLRND